MLVTKKNLILPLLLVFLLVNQCKPPDSATALLHKSLEAHGGKALWEQVATISYTKTTTLYTENGAVEKTIQQQHQNQLRPFGATQIWPTPEGTYRADLAPNAFTLTLNDTPVDDATAIAAALESIHSAFYVFWQPYKLLDTAAQLEFIGPKTLFNQREALVLKVTYPTLDTTDVWHYFFDPNTYRLIATAVEHNGKISLITNDAYETQTGLFLNRKRSSYFVDKDFNPHYRRASYDYKVENISWRKD